MRLFIGVGLVENVRDAAAAVADDLKRQVRSRVRAAWVGAEKMHLTVRFIGHVDDSRVPALLEALEPPLPIAPFEVALGQCGAFPRSGPPRVFWIGLAEGLPGLRAMHEHFNRRLAPLGFLPEDREFNAHLTLARVKEVTRGPSRAVRDTLDHVRVPAARCLIDHATVFQSLLSPKGATYQPLITVRCDRPQSTSAAPDPSPPASTETSPSRGRRET